MMTNHFLARVLGNEEHLVQGGLKTSLLSELSCGELCLRTLPINDVSKAMKHCTVKGIGYFLKGSGGGMHVVLFYT